MKRKVTESVTTERGKTVLTRTTENTQVRTEGSKTIIDTETVTERFTVEVRPGRLF